MKRLRNFLQKQGLQLFLVQTSAEAPPREALVNLRDFLRTRRAYTDSWFFLLRTLAGIGLLVTLVLQAWFSGQTISPTLLLVTSYVLANVAIHILNNHGFRDARWGFAALDVLAILFLRHRFHVEALLDANATLIALLTLILLAYVLYIDLRLHTALACTAIVVTVTTFCLEWPPTLPAQPMASSGPAVLHTLVLLSYLSAVSLITHQLVSRLYAQLLRYSVEQHERTQAAVGVAVERSRRERLEALNALKHKFVTVISHELRTPVTPLLSSLNILRDELNGQAQAYEMLTIAEESAERIHRMMTDYTRLADLITMDDEALKRWNVRLADLVESLQERTSRMPCLLGDFEDYAVFAEPRLLGGALLALLQRAQMLTPPDQTVTLKATRLPDQRIEISIHDPCSFLEADEIAALDDPFLFSSERVFASPTTGLELILAHHSILRAGGQMGIDSTADGGTTVSCSFPVSHPQADWLPTPRLRQELRSLGFEG